MCVCMCATESLPRLLKEIMQEAKRLTDAEWCVIITQLYSVLEDLYLLTALVVQIEHLAGCMFVRLDNNFRMNDLSRTTD